MLNGQDGHQMNRKNKDASELRILIVDDFKSRLKMLAKTITEYGCIADYASTYEDAVGKLENNYDLIAIDHFLHCGSMSDKGTGHDLKKSYLSRHPNSNVRIIQYSGNVKMIEDNDVQNETVDTMLVQEMIIDFIEKYSTATTKDKIHAHTKPLKQEPKQEQIFVPPPMPAPVSVPAKIEGNNMQKWPIGTMLSATVTVIILIAGIIGSYSVAQYKIDSTQAKVTTHCSDDAIYREKQAAKELQTVATMTELITMQREILKNIDELKREVKKIN